MPTQTRTNGFVTTRALGETLGSATYRSMKNYSTTFRRQHKHILESGNKRWPGDALGGWSRRYEYPYVADSLGPAPHAGATVLDAGTGLTFFPFYLADEFGWNVIATDYDNLSQAYQRLGHPNVSFRRTFLENIAADDESVDAVVCVSVLEHMDDPRAVVDQFSRIVKDRGRVVITMDISRDGRAQVPAPVGDEILHMLHRDFDPAHPDGHIEHMSAAVLSSASSPKDTLPWTSPLAYGVYNDVRARHIPRFKPLDLCCHTSAWVRKERHTQT